MPTALSKRVSSSSCPVFQWKLTPVGPYGPSRKISYAIGLLKLFSPLQQGYVKVSQVKQTKQEQISTGYFQNDLVGWEREWEDFRRADKGEGIGSAFGAAGRAGALVGIDAGG